jgi:hypothetical protein
MHYGQYAVKHSRLSLLVFAFFHLMYRKHPEKSSDKEQVFLIYCKMLRDLWFEEIESEVKSFQKLAKCVGCRHPIRENTSL